MGKFETPSTANPIFSGMKHRATESDEEEEQVELQKKETNEISGHFEVRYL